MPSGRRTWSDWDTQLHFAELALATMRVAAMDKLPVGNMEQRGMAMDEPCSIKMPEVTWLTICPGICWFADVFDVIATVRTRYHDEPGVVRVTFARRRGD